MTTEPHRDIKPGDIKPGDAVPGSWVDHMPTGLKPYLRLARLDRPIGIWLLMWPCWWGLALEALAQDRGLPNPWHLLLFLIGAVAMRGAGCAYNDIIDRDFDAHVARTKGRPLPSGQIGVFAATLFAAILSLIGLAVLLQFNAFTIWLGFGSLIFVGVYPFMKRITNWPQAVLGLTFNWGALVGWSAAADGLALAPLLLYAAGVAWTLGYDTIYALQDKDDDSLIGVKSTARLFGTKTRAWIVRFYAAAAFMLLAACLSAQPNIAAAILIVAACGHLVWQIKTLDIDNSARCLKLFKANHHFGLLVFLALLLGGWLG